MTTLKQICINKFGTVYGPIFYKKMKELNTLWLQQKQKDLFLIDDEWDNAQKNLFEELLEDLE